MKLITIVCLLCACTMRLLADANMIAGAKQPASYPRLLAQLGMDEVNAVAFSPDGAGWCSPAARIIRPASGTPRRASYCARHLPGAYRDR